MDTLNIWPWNSFSVLLMVCHFLLWPTVTFKWRLLWHPSLFLNPISPCHYFLCFTPKSIFLISSRIDLAVSHPWRSPAIRSLYPSSTPLPLHLLALSLPSPCRSLSHSAFRCHSLQMGLSLCRALEQCLGWMWLALLSILCCGIDAVCKALWWQPAVYYHHGTGIQQYEDGLPISQEGCVIGC